MGGCPENECIYPPWRECKTATDWAYNYVCNDEDYFLDAKCDEGLLRLKCVNKQGPETDKFRYYDPDAEVEMKRAAGRKNKGELEKSLRGKLKPKQSKRKKKSKKHKKYNRKKKQTKRKKR